MFPCSFLIVLVWVLIFKFLFIYFYFGQEFVDLAYLLEESALLFIHWLFVLLCLYFINFCSDFYFLLSTGFGLEFFSSVIKSFICDLSEFSMKILKAINFACGTAFFQCACTTVNYMHRDCKIQKHVLLGAKYSDSSGDKHNWTMKESISESRES